MKARTEEKILREFVKIMDDPDKSATKFRNYARTALTISMVFIFYCLSDGFEALENTYLLALAAFIAGSAFGLGIWFLQASQQTRLLVKFMSRDAIHNRLEEIAP